MKTRRHVYLDDATWRNIDELAGELYEGNTSMALRIAARLGAEQMLANLKTKRRRARR